MGSSETPLKLPITDYSKQALTPGSKEWETVRTQVHNAPEEYGCFEALFYKVPPHIRKSIFQSMEEPFNLPLQTKLQNVSMGVDDVNIYEQVQRLINTLWPQENPSFCKTIQSFSEQVSELDQIIRRMILESLGLEKYFEEHLVDQLPSTNDQI
ncbi:PREDICTED: probable [Prunus dulcis]|uniref:PREDICTED: probable n=1 Tax=Prunus dulcis TaxID=3755 RepID=A0A5E4GEU3_PRUDU|nr:PREDICTED: probable [Prunus dulcis]